MKVFLRSSLKNFVQTLLHSFDRRYIQYVQLQLQCSARYPLQLYRSETWRISLLREHPGVTNDIDTIEYATFRYDTVEVEKALQ